MSEQVAYLITVGTYGSRLHGDERGTVDRSHNNYGAHTLGEDETRESVIKQYLNADSVQLDFAQQCFVEDIAEQIAKRGGWELHVVSAAQDHFHVVLTGDAKPQIIRSLFKRWMTQELNKKWSGNATAGWWAEGGSCKYLWNADSLRRAVDYVANQRCRIIRNSE